MDDVRRVDVLESAQDLVEKPADVVIGQLLLRVDNPMEIALHQIQNYIDVLEHRQVLLRTNDLSDRDDVIVPEVFEDPYFPVRAHRHDHLLEDLRDLLDGDFLARPTLDCRADNAVRARADVFDRIVVRVL